MAPTPLISASPAVVEALSSVGTVLVFIMCAAQLPTFRLVYLRRLDLAKVSFLPTLGQLSNFSTWTMYGSLGAMNPTVVMVNLLGCGFSALYIGLFLFFAPTPRRLQIARMLGLFALAFGAAEAAILLSTSGQADTRRAALAYVSIACNVVMYGSPIGAMRVALARMDPSQIPLLLTVAALACSACWGLYGLLIADYNILAPNVAGAALTIAQLVVGVFVTYRVAQDPDLTRRLARERRLGADSDEDEDELGLLGTDGGGVVGGGAKAGLGDANANVSLSVSS